MIMLIMYIISIVVFMLIMCVMIVIVHICYLYWDVCLYNSIIMSFMTSLFSLNGVYDYNQTLGHVNSIVSFYT